MKRTGIAASVVIIALISAFALFNRCAGGDMATVTINFHSNEITQTGGLKSLLAKALNLFISPVYAEKSPITKSDVTSIHLSVSGPDMDQIDVDIPPTTDQYTLMVPPGANRLFIVSAYGPDPYYVGGTIEKLLEGSNTISLEEGDYVSITISMVQVFW